MCMCKIYLTQTLIFIQVNKNDFMNTIFYKTTIRCDKTYQNIKNLATIKMKLNDFYQGKMHSINKKTIQNNLLCCCKPH